VPELFDNPELLVPGPHIIASITSADPTSIIPMNESLTLTTTNLTDSSSPRLDTDQGGLVGESAMASATISAPLKKRRNATAPAAPKSASGVVWAPVCETRSGSKRRVEAEIEAARANSRQTQLSKKTRMS
jgi:hypothetical protein